MNILIANDDGIQARGLKELIQALKGRVDGSIYVCAPDGQRSAAGHGITVAEPVFLKEIKLEGVEKAYTCSGLPADCVKLGLRVLEAQNISIDLVYSGINHGANLGSDTLYSGTVSAAMEGAICGKPSVAVSLCSHEAVHFESCHEIAAQMVAVAFDFFGDKKGVLNVNVPDLPLEEIKGILTTSVGEREYALHSDPIPREDGSLECGYSGKAIHYEGLSNSVDVGAYQDGYITVSPLQYDLTDYEKLVQLGERMQGMDWSETEPCLC